MSVRRRARRDWKPPKPFHEARYPIVGTTGFYDYKTNDLVQLVGKGKRLFQIKYFTTSRNRRTTFAVLIPVCLKDGAISQPPGRGNAVRLGELVKISPLMLLAMEADQDVEPEDE